MTIAQPAAPGASPYHAAVKGVGDLEVANRYVPMAQRRDCSDIPSPAWDALAVKNAYAQKWRNLVHNKGPFEIALYQMLLQELRPRTIIEFGALQGGSAVWLADLAQVLDIPTQIISLDIDISLLGPEAREDSRITFLEGDANAIEDVLSHRTLKALPHPWLVIEDCHVNTEGLLDHVHQAGCQVGDYVIVEDTNQDAWDAWRNAWMDEARVRRGKEKLPATRRWVDKHPEYQVDTRYTDLYGYNVTKNWNSVLRKMA